MAFPKLTDHNLDADQLVTSTISAQALVQYYNEAHDLTEESAVLELTTAVKNWAEKAAKEAGWKSMAFVGSLFVVTSEVPKQPASAKTTSSNSATPMPAHRQTFDLRGRQHDATRR